MLLVDRADARAARQADLAASPATSWPRISLNSVDLPTPLRPTRPTLASLGRLTRRLVEEPAAPGVEDEVFDLQHGQHLARTKRNCELYAALQHKRIGSGPHPCTGSGGYSKCAAGEAGRPKRCIVPLGFSEPGHSGVPGLHQRFLTCIRCWAMSSRTICDGPCWRRPSSARCSWPGSCRYNRLPSASVFVLASIVVPALLPALFSIVPQRPEIRLRNHLLALAADAGSRACKACSRSPSWPTTRSAWAMRSSGFHSCVRNPATSAGVDHGRAIQRQAHGSTCPGSIDRWRVARPCGVVAAAGATWATPSLLPLALPLALLWLAAPAVARWASQPPAARPASARSAAMPRTLRLIARRTWRFFETFVTPPTTCCRPTTSRRTRSRSSPTAPRRPTSACTCCRPSPRATSAGPGRSRPSSGSKRRSRRCRRWPRFRGHFFNWYDTPDLRALDPAYVSSVDSGNLAGHLIALANACEEWIASRLPPPTGRARHDRHAAARPRGGRSRLRQRAWLTVDA